MSTTHRRLTLTLPSSLVQDLTRLAELRGRGFGQELAEDLAFVLAMTGTPRPATMLEQLFELAHHHEPLERVAVELPRELADVLGGLARAHGITRGKALAAVMRRAMRRLLAAETMRLERGVAYVDAFFAA